MANYQQQPGNGQQDPAGSTQMFRAFVDEDAAPAGAAPGTSRRAAAPAQSAGPRVGLIVGIVVAIVVVVAAVWLAV